MDIILTLALLAAIGYVIYLKFFSEKSDEKQVSKKPVQLPENKPLPYRRKYLLTKNEWKFYQELKKVADKNGLHVLSKIRIADIVEPSPEKDYKEWSRNFARIRSKHIDFVLAKPENLFVQLLIELDDTSHEKESAKQRDAFVERLYKDTGYPLLRVRNALGLEEKILSALATDANKEETVNS